MILVFLRQVLSWLLWNSLWRLGRPPTIDTRCTHAHMHRISSYLYPVMPLAGDEGQLLPVCNGKTHMIYLTAGKAQTFFKVYKSPPAPLWLENTCSFWVSLKLMNIYFLNAVPSVIFKRACDLTGDTTHEEEGGGEGSREREKEEEGGRKTK